MLSSRRRGPRSSWPTVAPHSVFGPAPVLVMAEFSGERGRYVPPLFVPDTTIEINRQCAICPLGEAGRVLANAFGGPLGRGHGCQPKVAFRIIG